MMTTNTGIADEITDIVVTVAEFEQQVWDKEGIKITVRLPKDALVLDYLSPYTTTLPWKNAVNYNTRVSKWLQARIYPCLQKGADVDVHHGRHKDFKNNIFIGTLRDSYKD